MKKNILFYALMGAVIATMASCSHDSNEVLADAQKKPVIVEVSMADAATRAGYEQGAFPTDLKIGMCFNYNDANEGTYESIISYNGGWVLTPQIYWPDYTGEIPYYAYAPYDAGKTYDYGKVIHSVETDQTSLENLNKSDLLIAQGAKKNTDEGILQLEFTHAHALLTMSFNVTDCTVTGVSIPNVATSIQDNIVDGTTETAPQSETIDCYEEGDNKFCCFIPAQTIESDFRIMVTLSDGRKLTYTHPEAITFTRNRIANFAFDVVEKISIDKVTVEDWNSADIPDTDATYIEAAYRLDEDYKELTLDVSEYVSSVAEAVNAALEAECTTIHVNGKLSEDLQTELATRLASFKGGIIFNDMTLEELTDNITGLQSANVVDSEGTFAYVSPQNVTLPNYKGYELTVENQRGGYVFTDGDGNSGNYSSIVVKSGVHNITLQDCNLTGMNASPIDIAPGATVYLTVSGTNTLSRDGYRAAISVPEGATLVITKASNGSLTAIATYPYAAGIGGDSYSSYSSGRITINGGTIVATGAKYGAGIGSSANNQYVGATCGDITINGGNVTATGGESAAGIGGGYYNPGGNVTINGGTVKAVGANGADGIGKGSGGEHSGTLTIGADATVTSNGQTMSPTE